MLCHAVVSNSFVTLGTVVCQAPLSKGFSRQEHWSGLPSLPPGDLPDPGIKSISPVSPALAGRFFTTEAQRSRVCVCVCMCVCPLNQQPRICILQALINNNFGVPPPQICGRNYL